MKGVLDLVENIEAAQPGLVTELAGPEKVRDVAVQLENGALEVLSAESVVVDLRRVLPHLARPFGDQEEFEFLVSGDECGEEAPAEHVGIFELEMVGRAVLVPARLLGAGEAGVSAELDLVAAVVEEGEGIARGELCVQLEVAVLEGRLVGKSASGDQVDLVAPVGSPQPEPVDDEGTANLSAIILHGAHAVAGSRDSAGGELALELRRNVRGLPTIVRDEKSRGSMKVIGAAFRDHVDLNAGALLGSIYAPGRDLNFREGIEVEI